MKKRKVPFDEKEVLSKKKHGKKLHKKSKFADPKDSGNGAGLNKKAEIKVKVTSKDDDTVGRVKETKDDRPDKADQQQKPHAKATQNGDKKPLENCYYDAMKKWPFVDFKQKLNMDLFAVSNIARGQPDKRQAYLIDTNNLMTSLNNRSNVKTLGFQRRSSVSLYSNYEAIGVLSSLQEEQKRRHQEYIRSDLALIQKRVRKALENIGMESDSEDEESPEKLPSLHVFSTSSERKKLLDRNRTIGRIEAFEETALVRKQYLTELMIWFQDHLKIFADLVTPEEMKEMVRTTNELHQVISKSLESFIINGKQVVEKGKLLLAETNKIIDERRGQITKKMSKERIIMFDDKTLVSDPSKWESAAKTVLSVFEDSHKMIKNLMFKNTLNLCQKQFDYMMLACDKRFKGLDEKKKHCIELQGKLHIAKIQNDKMSRESDEQKRKFTKLSQELKDTKTALENLQEKNNSMKDEIVKLNSSAKFLQQELLIKNRTPTPPPTPSPQSPLSPPPPPPEPEKIYINVVDSSTQLNRKELEKELEEAKREIEKLNLQLNEVNEQLRFEQECTMSLQEKLTELESIAILEPLTWEVTTEPETPEVTTEPETPEVTTEPVAPQFTTEVELPALQGLQQPSDLPEKGSNYYKTLMTGMKKEFEIEKEKMRSHVRKEKTRGEAIIKKMEYRHKDQFAYLQKDTVRILQAIMHFREHMLVCLEKENLLDQAEALDELGDIAKDKLSPDPKEVKSSIVGTVVEYLNKMEGILSNSFLAMRVYLKYQIDRQVEAEVHQRMAFAEVRTKQKEMKATKKNVKDVAKSLKKVKNELKESEEGSTNFSADKKYRDLLTRYKSMMKMYKSMQKEMNGLQTDFHDIMQRKLEEEETMVISQKKMEKQMIAEEKLKISIAEQRENLKMLHRAYEENKISKELHLMASAMIQKSIDIPRRKLKNLFERYITYKTIQDSKASIASVLNDKSVALSDDTRREMEQYVKTIEGKVSHSMKKWKNEMEQLENEKRDLNEKIYLVFNEVLLETGVLLVHPLFRDKDKTDSMRKAASLMERKQLKDIFFNKKRRCKEILSLPAELLGRAVKLDESNSKFWTQRQDSKLWTQRQQPNTDAEAHVVLPHMLAYEINKPKIDAFSRRFRGGRQSYQLAKTENFDTSLMNYAQFVRDIPLYRTEMKSMKVNLL